MNLFKRFALLGLLLLVIGAVGCLFSYKSLITATVSISKDKIITGDFNQLEVQSDNAEVDVKPTTDSKAHVKLTGTDTRDSRVKFNTDISENTLKVGLFNNQRNFFNFDFIPKKLTLTVYLPKKIYQMLQIKNNNGIVSVQNVSSIRVYGLTQNGFMQLTDTSSQIVNVHTDNGKIQIDHVNGDLIGSTDNGQITVNTADLNRNMDLHCSNGKISVQTDQQPTNTRFDVQVNNGRINILNKYQGNAVIGNGDHIIKLSTDNGEIDVTK